MAPPSAAFSALTLLNTRMAVSGHMTAQDAQPVHWPLISMIS